MIRRPPRSTQSRSSAASDVYKRQISTGFNSLLKACAIFLIRSTVSSTIHILSSTLNTRVHIQCNHFTALYPPVHYNSLSPNKVTVRRGKAAVSTTSSGYSTRFSAPRTIGLLRFSRAPYSSTFSVNVPPSAIQFTFIQYCTGSPYCHPPIHQWG